MKVGVVGCGLVGSTAAYALVMRGVAREVVLVDRHPDRAAAEADDIRHAVPFAHEAAVRAGDYPDLAGCGVVLLTAGVTLQPGETRLDVLGRNAAVFREVVPPVVGHAPDAVLIAATNPVDVMTHLTAGLAAAAGRPPGRVVGSGTTLDTARFRTLLGTHFGVDSHHVHAYVVGEHGDSEVLAWSSAAIGGVPVAEYARHRGVVLDDPARADIDAKVRRAGAIIHRGKGATNFGVGAALARITAAVLDDQRAVLTVCAPAADVAGVPDVTVSLPRLVGRDGAVDTLPLPLAPDEQAALRHSAEVIRAAIEAVG